MNLEQAIDIYLKEELIEVKKAFPNISDREARVRQVIRPIRTSSDAWKRIHEIANKKDILDD